MFGLFNDTMSTVGCSVPDGKLIIDDTLGWVWTEAVVTYFKIYPHDLLERTVLNYEKSKLEQAFNSSYSNKEYSQCMTTRHLN
jgi:hypothetical protein